MHHEVQAFGAKHVNLTPQNQVSYPQKPNWRKLRERLCTTTAMYWKRILFRIWWLDLRDTDKSRYFAITKFNNCFIIRSPSLLSYLKGNDLPFLCKSVVIITHEQNIISYKAHLEGTTHEQTIICRQIFAVHVVNSQPMKRKGKMHKTVIKFGDLHLQVQLHHYRNNNPKRFLGWTRAWPLLHTWPHAQCL